MFPQHLQRCIRYKAYSQLCRWLPGMGRQDIPWREPVLMLADLSSLAAHIGRKIWQKFAGLPVISRTQPAAAPISIDEDVIAGT